MPTGETMPSVTQYQLWQHTSNRELWVIRVEQQTLTGLHGPVTSTIPDTHLADLLYEDHPDDLEWIIRASEDFNVVKIVEVG
jgi:hypothetical protein